MVQTLPLNLKHGGLDEFKTLVCQLSLKVSNVNHFSSFEFAMIGKIYILECPQNHFHGNHLRYLSRNIMPYACIEIIYMGKE